MFRPIIGFAIIGISKICNTNTKVFDNKKIQQADTSAPDIKKKKKENGNRRSARTTLSPTFYSGFFLFYTEKTQCLLQWLWKPSQKFTFDFILENLFGRVAGLWMGDIRSILIRQVVNIEFFNKKPDTFEKTSGHKNQLLNLSKG